MRAKGIRKVRAKDITECMRKAAEGVGFDGMAFSAKSMRSGRQSDCYHRGVPENERLPLADMQRGANWKLGSSVPGSFYTALMHGRGEFALATDDIDWSLVGKKETESMLVRRDINQRACERRDEEVVAAVGTDAAPMEPALKRAKKPSKKAAAAVGRK